MHRRSHCTRRVHWTILSSVLVVLAVSGCAGTVDIAKLVEKPDSYAGKTVQVRGDVVTAAGIVGRGYHVQDETGTILIVAQGHGVPADGSQVRLKGKFEPVFGLDGSSVPAILQTNP